MGDPCRGTELSSQAPRQGPGHPPVLWRPHFRQKSHGGKDKLVVLARRAGWEVSTSMVGRILHNLEERGLLWEPDLRDPCIVKRRHKRPYATRKPRDYVAKVPGDLVEVDTADIRLLPGEGYKHFGARDVIG